MKFKFYKDKGKYTNKQRNIKNRCSYAQVFSVNIKNIVKIKKSFSSLSTKKIKEVQKIINEPKKEKPSFSIITKELLRRQVLEPMSSSNWDKFIMYFNKHITNINSVLKDIKSDVIYSNSRELTITTNKVVSSLDLNNIMIPRLP